jgi:hypothetical protein
VQNVDVPIAGMNNNASQKRLWVILKRDFPFLASIREPLGQLFGVFPQIVGALYDRVTRLPLENHIAILVCHRLSNQKAPPLPQAG